MKPRRRSPASRLRTYTGRSAVEPTVTGFNDVETIVLPGLQGNTEAQLSTLQEFLLGHLSFVEAAWWCVWWSVLGYLLVRYVFLAGVRREKP